MERFTKVLSYDNPRDCKLFLKSYAHTYLKEEIQLEQLVRNMDPFRKFLPVAAMSHMRFLNYSKIARDAGVEAPIMVRYSKLFYCLRYIGGHLIQKSK